MSAPSPEAIIGHKGRGKKTVYLIKWRGYDKEHNSFQPRDLCEKFAPDLLRNYEAEQGLNVLDGETPKKARKTPSKVAATTPASLRKRARMTSDADDDDEANNSKNNDNDDKDANSSVSNDVTTTTTKKRDDAKAASVTTPAKRNAESLSATTTNANISISTTTTAAATNSNAAASTTLTTASTTAATSTTPVAVKRSSNEKKLSGEHPNVGFQHGHKIAKIERVKKTDSGLVATVRWKDSNGVLFDAASSVDTNIVMNHSWEASIELNKFYEARVTANSATKK